MIDKQTLSVLDTETKPYHFKRNGTRFGSYAPEQSVLVEGVIIG